jgi:hypothetical protein
VCGDRPDGQKGEDEEGLRCYLGKCEKRSGGRAGVVRLPGYGGSAEMRETLATRARALYAAADDDDDGTTVLVHPCVSALEQSSSWSWKGT